MASLVDEDGVVVDLSAKPHQPKFPKTEYGKKVKA
jgi:hypothetical protein